MRRVGVGTRESGGMALVRSDTLNLLTARACDSAGPGTVLRDGGGLFLEVTPAGKKY